MPGLWKDDEGGLRNPFMQPARHGYGSGVIFLADNDRDRHAERCEVRISASFFIVSTTPSQTLRSSASEWINTIRGASASGAGRRVNAMVTPSDAVNVPS
jgi:hypothetical protein